MTRYNDNSARVAAYLTWPDARLRAYLREHNIPEEALPTSRPGLLRTSCLVIRRSRDADSCPSVVLCIEEVRIRYVQSTSRAEALYNKIRDAVMEGVEVAEEKIGDVSPCRRYYVCIVAHY